jgi:hypothetical protein
MYVDRKFLGSDKETDAEPRVSETRNLPNQEFLRMPKRVGTFACPWKLAHTRVDLAPPIDKDTFPSIKGRRSILCTFDIIYDISELPKRLNDPREAASSQPKTRSKGAGLTIHFRVQLQGVVVCLAFCLPQW